MSVDQLLAFHAEARLASRIWAHDPDAFLDSARYRGADRLAAKTSISNRLGWLTATDDMRPEMGRVEALADSLTRDGLTDVYLLGMGGSSLCAEVVRETLGRRSTGARLTVLDTTDEAAIRRAAAALVPARACFLVASKSGSTIEVTSLEEHFRSVMAAAVAEPGRHFVAITDAGTSLVDHARTHGYRETFINPSTIGGRYSALSLFGLIPARLCGVRSSMLLEPATEMARRCRGDLRANPGLALGVFMGGHAAAGRDKLTLLASPPLAPFGVWVEQLVAESTGKHGLGVLPVVDEPCGSPHEYASDRAFVVMITPGDQALDEQAGALERAGHPVFRIMTSPGELGGEFFRWEFATAVAGAVLGVNPFDEPDVRRAKVFTKAQLDAHAASAAFAARPPLTPRGGYSVREFRGERRVPATYLAVLDYLPASGESTAAVARLRTQCRARLGLATTHGVGPRYLHSTGQYHKGGPNTGVFLILTSGDDTDTSVPGAAYTFGTLKRAQAFGDFDALKEAGRQVIHCHFDQAPRDVSAVYDAITRAIA